MSDASERAIRLRREPPAFRRVTVAGTERITPRLIRVTLTGPELDGLTVSEPAASVRLLLPPPGESSLVMPTWTGNEFRLADGSRPIIRTLTPVRTKGHELDVDVVVHDGGTASAWAAGAGAGDEAAVSGPGRGYTVDPDAPAFLVGGDETAIPAIRQVLAALPESTPVRVLVEVADPAARLPLAADDVTWLDLPAGAAPGDAMVAAVRGADLDDGTHVWIAGEAAAVQRIRRHLFDERDVPRSRTWIRGYWKHGRAGDDD
jgi:NADPH-dependent ferric siderophore reductase